MGGGRRAALTVFACVLVWVTSAGAASWSPPTTLWTSTDPSVSAISPNVAIDDAGYGIALVPRVQNLTSSLGAFLRMPGGPWQESPDPPFSRSGYGDGVAIDPAGNAIAVWVVASTTATSVDAATWSVSLARWSSPQTVATSPGVPAGQGISASSNASGQIVVAWQSQLDNVVAVYGVVGATSGKFSSAVRVGTLRRYHRADDVRTAMGAAGDSAIQWTDDDGAWGGPQTNIEVAVRPAAGEFATDAPAPVTDLSAPDAANGGAIAVDAAGDVLSVFYTSHQGQRIASSYRPAGGTFAAPQAVPSIGDADSGESIAVAFDGAGNATIAWVAMVVNQDAPVPSPPVVLESAARPPGVSAVWEQPVQLTDPIDSIERVQIAETTAGSAILAAEAIGPSADADIVFTRLPNGSFASEGDPGGCEGSIIAMSRDGDAALGCYSAAIRAEQVVVRSIHGPSLSGLQTPAVPIAGSSANFAVAVPGWAELIGGMPEWTFGDGSSGSGTAVRHSYAKAGIYTLTVTAAAADGSAPARVSRRVVVLPKGTILVGLRSAHASGERLIVHGTASGRGAITLTVRRRGRRTTVTVLRVALRGGDWTRSFRLPARLSHGTYAVVASGTKVRGSTISFRLG